MSWHELLSRIIAKVSVRKRVRSVALASESVCPSILAASSIIGVGVASCHCSASTAFQLQLREVLRFAGAGIGGGPVLSAVPPFVASVVETSSIIIDDFRGRRKRKEEEKEIYDVWSSSSSSLNALDEIPVCHLAGGGATVRSPCVREDIYFFLPMCLSSSVSFVSYVLIVS